MAEKRKITTGKPRSKARKIKTASLVFTSWRIFLLLVLAVTFILYLPALQNGFTNWDDMLYVTQNPLLKDLSFSGLKAIFTTPVVSNYHPLTILSLALNYQLAELSPMTYHLTSIILHVINTGLVFWFIWLLSSGNKWVSAFTALLFGIHPMHVESVAWISERKDLLYTLFYLLAMGVYIKYVYTRQAKWLIIVFLLGAISLLCKPAAIVLPISLLAIDYYLRREWTWSWILEKIPLFILSGVIAYVTLTIQSERAIASVTLYGILERICFAGFGLVWYLLKLIVPYPLSALHPFPKELTVFYYLATAVSIAGVLLLILKVRNRNYLFGFGFYIINLLLVLQLISIGNAVVAERYTYVPYIGIFFLFAIEIFNTLKRNKRKLKWVVISVVSVWMVLLAYLTWSRIPVWRDSQTLWEDVLHHYPNSARAWTNKGLDLYVQKQWPEVIEHLSKALTENPNHKDALEWRIRTYLEMKDAEKALQDATLFQQRYPKNEVALFLLARSHEASGQAETAVATYTQLLALYPDKPEYINNRGVVYFNWLRKFDEAQADFEHAIRLQPENGSFYLNISRCYYMKGDINSARKNAARGVELGAAIDPGYAKLVGLE